MDAPARRPRARAARGLTVALLLALGAACAGLRPAPPALSDPAAALGEAAPGDYRLLLPPGREADPRGLPLVVFLHDYFGSSAVLWRSGAAAEIVRRMASGEMPPVAVLAPGGGRGFWSDSHDGRRRYESWVADELLPRVERATGVGGDRTRRQVTGISMGGYGAMKLQLRRPELFSGSSSLSGALAPFDWEFVTSAPWPLRRQLRRVFGPSADDNSLAANDVVALLDRPWPDGVPRPPLLLRCGRQDSYRLHLAAEKYAAAARARGFPVELVLEEGRHDWSYWRRSVVEVVAWHARALAAAAEGSR